jgi:hypothetical protein
MMSLARLASMVESLSHLRLEETLSQFAAPLKEQVGPGGGVALSLTLLQGLQQSS